MTPHDFRRIALAHDLLSRDHGTDPAPRADRREPVPDGDREKEGSTPAISAAREEGG